MKNNVVRPDISKYNLIKDDKIDNSKNPVVKTLTTIYKLFKGTKTY